jgi:hypothetical protein
MVSLSQSRNAGMDKSYEIKLSPYPWWGLRGDKLRGTAGDMEPDPGLA